eukprot:9441924-Pyramimonas_sp.AAC.1
MSTAYAKKDGTLLKGSEMGTSVLKHVNVCLDVVSSHTAGSSICGETCRRTHCSYPGGNALHSTQSDAR